MLNLMNELSDKDKNLIEVYLKNYSNAGTEYIGNEVFLKHWSENKKTLYKLLGGKFQAEFPFDCSTSQQFISDRFYNMTARDYFWTRFQNLIYDFSREGNYIYKSIEHIENVTKYPNYLDFYRALECNGNIEKDINLKIVDKKRSLRINKGASGIKIVGKLVRFALDNIPAFKDKYPNFLDEYEAFRIKHSMIFNDSHLQGKFVISIHPLDYLTMSNNSLNWSSCMNWAKNDSSSDSGCYHVGTVEMMNSNNVVCCYLKSNTPYEFHKDKKTGECYLWNNKRWRSLAIVTPDILLGGKAYPYAFDDLTFFMLDRLKELAEHNKGWTYTYGRELYKDMTHVNSNHKIIRNRNWIALHETTKHNIILDTNGMYNDFLNDGNTKYYCYRNKVKHNKVINISGKTCCTCCGDPSIDIYDYEAEDYNERFDNVNYDICYECLDNFEKCYVCHKLNNNSESPVRKIKIWTKDKSEYSERNYCYNCFKHNFFVCKECGGIHYSFLPKMNDKILLIKNNENEKIPSRLKKWEIELHYKSLYICSSCVDTIVKTEKFGKVKEMSFIPSIYSTDENVCSYYLLENNNLELDKYTKENIQKPTEEEFYKVTEEIQNGDTKRNTISPS